MMFFIQHSTDCTIKNCFICPNVRRKKFVNKLSLSFLACVLSMRNIAMRMTVKLHFAKKLKKKLMKEPRDQRSNFLLNNIYTVS